MTPNCRRDSNDPPTLDGNERLFRAHEIQYSCITALL
jgi:hypothetical protein